MDGTLFTAGSNDYQASGVRSTFGGNNAYAYTDADNWYRPNAAISSNHYNFELTVNSRPTIGAAIGTGMWPSVRIEGNNNYQSFKGAGRINTASEQQKRITGLRFANDSGNFAHGRVTLYRIKYS